MCDAAIVADHFVGGRTILGARGSRGKARSAHGVALARRGEPRAPFGGGRVASIPEGPGRNSGDATAKA